MFEALTIVDAWLPWRTARDPFDGWSGGAQVTFEQNGIVCVTAAARFDDDRTALLFVHALTQWGQISGTNAVPSATGRDVSFTTCERGAATANPPRPILTPSESAAAETAFLTGFSDGGGTDIELARCYTRIMIDDAVLGPLWFKAELTADEGMVVDHQSEVARTTCLAERGG